MRRPPIVALFLTLASALSVAPAHASPNYPDAIKAAVPSLPCIPQCTLCHNTNPGMAPATKPFVMKLKTFKVGVLGGENTTNLTDALKNMANAAAPTDADSDGTNDYTELAMGSDPNSNDPAATLCVTVPLYGCGASTIAHAPVERTTDPAALAAASLAALAGLLVMRRRRR